ALVGGFGGLVGWLLVSLVNSIIMFNNAYLNDALIGPIIGVCIGLAVGSTEGLVSSRSLRRAWQSGRIGALLGAIGGLVGLLLGEWLFHVAGGGVWPRALGWGLFGMFVGISDGVARQMPVKVRYGLLGGLLGGLIGGSTYEGLLAVIGGLGSRAAALSWGGAIGLTILGACIGLLVSLVEVLLRKSWLFFLTGRLEGQTRTLESGRPQTIGSAPQCTIVIPEDATVAAVHAEIVFRDEAFVIQPREGPITVRRDGTDHAVTPAGYSLKPNDRILIGQSRMIFRDVERKKA
ncbi:MAG: FHA domain-containing protein, partial [Gemmataceae bacterium]|nr:FHA domain-containing protein [Gemmataceae bacterium]MDW8266038.1 FHA domain-containing protein [Gemmataceae bacterium]